MSETDATSQQPSTAVFERCTLDDGDLTHRVREIASLLEQHMVDCRRAGDSVLLSFRTEAAASVRDLVGREQECCGFLEYTIDESDDQTIRVVVRSPQDAEVATVQVNACGCPMCA